MSMTDSLSASTPPTPSPEDTQHLEDGGRGNPARDYLSRTPHSSQARALLHPHPIKYYPNHRPTRNHTVPSYSYSSPSPITQVHTKTHTPDIPPNSSWISRPPNIHCRGNPRLVWPDSLPIVSWICTDGPIVRTRIPHDDFTAYPYRDRDPYRAGDEREEEERRRVKPTSNESSAMICNHPMLVVRDTRPGAGFPQRKG